jgi:uncharacterized membrane protein
MRPWLIPMIYVGASVAAGLIVPRLEQAYGASYRFDLAVASAQAYLSAAASGMMALTGIVFAMAFLMVQFSALAYSPRLVLWFARDRGLFHALGVFSATFMYALFTLAWKDRAGSGIVPLFSSLAVAVLLIISMVLFTRLVQRLSDLQVTNVLHLIGDQGRQVIRDMFRRLDEGPTAPQANLEANGGSVHLGPATQTLRYSGNPRIITTFDVPRLIRAAQQADGVIVMACAVGDTLTEDTVLLRIHGARASASDDDLMRAIRLDRERTFEQDPKYPMRLLVEVAVRALSPAVNDPTTAVHTIDQIEDLLQRLGRRELDDGRVCDQDGVLRLIVPMTTWEDYLALGLDEIRQYGVGSVQVMRRLRSALVALLESAASEDRAQTLRRYLARLDRTIERSLPDVEDRFFARQEDRQGLGHSQRPSELKELV